MQLLLFEVDAQALLAELQANVGLGLGQVEQAAVEVAAVHGVDGLAVLPVGLLGEVALRVVHHAAIHRDAHLADVIGHAHAFQGPPAAVGKGQIDGAAFLEARPARVGA